MPLARVEAILASDDLQVTSEDVVYDCSQMVPNSVPQIRGAFHLGGQGFFLLAHCNMDQQSSFHCFGLFLWMQVKGLVTFAVDYEFAARSKPTEEYISKYKETIHSLVERLLVTVTYLQPHGLLSWPKIAFTS